VVTGKGGVGKSTVAAALAIAAQQAGQRVLAVELEPNAGLAAALRVTSGRAGVIVASPSGVAVSYFEGSAALAEYLERVVRLGPLLGRVLAHPLYRAFVGAAPGLSELMVIGKIRDELVLRKLHGRPRWDALVLDAGSTGHALELLRMASAAARTFGRGRVNRNARRIHALLSDPAQTSVHVVATPEEMPIAEAVELIGRLRELGLPIGRLIVNACRETPPEGADVALTALETLKSSDAESEVLRSALLHAARRELGWARIQGRAIEALERRAGLAVWPLPLIPTALDSAALSQLGSLLAEVVR
jgi:anion-transporting  ArsA/GET3 family ATPase